MKLIAAVDKNWAIGYGNRLLVRIPADQKFFHKETLGKAVIVGRKTLESFPGGLPLSGRTNIVLTTQPDYRCKGVVIVHSVAEALKAAEGFASEDVYVIGGSSVYRQFLPYCDTAEVTAVDYAYQADTYLQNLEKDAEWELTGVSEEQTYYDLVYEFRKYERRKE